MSVQTDSSHVVKLPREPFLLHSAVLVEHLFSFAPASRKQVLEIGCGPQSPLLPLLSRLCPGSRIHQIDAQAELIAEAAKWNPTGKVEQMLASNMSSIPSQSKDLVIAMSVFDQNPEHVVEAMAGEIHRVLADDGVAIYVHNEELNLPATAASMLTHATGPQLLFPNNSWDASNDFEYCSGVKSEIEAAFAEHSARLAPVGWFLRGVLPQIFGDRQVTSANGKIDVPFLRECTFPVMSKIRENVAFMRQQLGVDMQDHRTGDLLKDLIEGRLFSRAHGFEIVRAGVFEIRRCVEWKSILADRPPQMCFVRGVSRFGYATNDPPGPAVVFEQELNHEPLRDEQEVLLIAYQYGVVARKIAG